MNQKELLADFRQGVIEGLKELNDALTERQNNIWNSYIPLEEQILFIRRDISFLFWAIARLSIILAQDDSVAASSQDPQAAPTTAP